MKRSAGFTLIEIIVVVAIIGVLAAVLYGNFNQGSAQSRDVQRQGDLRNLQNAIELYKQKYGRYPAGCNSYPNWSGQLGTNYACGNGTAEYIVGHVDVNDLDGDGDTTDRLPFAREFISVLPKDPKLNGTNSGYMYLTNSDGSAYKLMAARTVETETMTVPSTLAGADEFLSCEVTNSSEGVCDSVYRNPNSGTMNFNNVAPDCESGDTVLRTSYGLWGGYPEEGWVCPHTRCQDNQERVICPMPN